MSGDQPYDLGVLIPTEHHYSLLEHVLEMVPRGHALEFGVGLGHSTRIIDKFMDVTGFDSFLGLPEDWRDEFPRGSFACDPPADLLLCDVALVVGMFADTVPEWVACHGNYKVTLIHIDCDLYSSTKTVLDNVRVFLQPGTCVVFDEWHGYDGAEQYEQRAWREFVEGTDLSWRVLGHGHEAWGIRLV